MALAVARLSGFEIDGFVNGFGCLADGLNLCSGESLYLLYIFAI